jgi:hypothetical protein
MCSQVENRSEWDEQKAQYQNEQTLRAKPKSRNWW